MNPARKPFRIEAFTQAVGPSVAPANDAGPLGGSSEILAEIRALKAMIKPAETVTQSMIDAYRGQMQEALKLKAELDQIYTAINETKQEIATLHVSGFQGKEMTRVTHELDAIVSGTETATEGILSAAEAIDQIAAQLSAKVKDASDRGALDDISQKIILIFEQCNFQDLTGQRITKVVNTLKFIEDRIGRMIDIWGGLETFQGLEVEGFAEKIGDAALLNGPKLEEDPGHASQDDIDALFA